MDQEVMINALVNGEIALEAIEKELYVCDFRKMIYRELHTKLSKQHINIIRKLMVIEIAEREKDPYDDEIVIEETYDYEAFYWCIFLLSRIGDVHDVFTIWYAGCENNNGGTLTATSVPKGTKIPLRNPRLGK